MKIGCYFLSKSPNHVQELFQNRLAPFSQWLAQSVGCFYFECLELVVKRLHHPGSDFLHHFDAPGLLSHAQLAGALYLPHRNRLVDFCTGGFGCAADYGSDGEFSGDSGGGGESGKGFAE